MQQRDGRIVRQGNENPEVQIYKYVTENTFDSYSWTLLANKQKFIGQVYTSKNPERTADDVDDFALNCEQIMALSTNNPIFREKIELDIDVNKLKTSRKIHNDQNQFLEDKILSLPKEIETCEKNISQVAKDIDIVNENPTFKDTFKMEVNGEIFTDKKSVGEKIIDLFKNFKGFETKDIGNYRGFKLKISNSLNTPKVHLENNKSYSIIVENSAIGNITRIDNALEKLPNNLENLQNQLNVLQKELNLAKSEVGKPFAKENEYQEKSQRLAFVNKEIENVEAKENSTTDKEIPTKKPPTKGEER